MTVKWIVCVVALNARYPKRVYEPYYLGVNGDKQQAMILQDKIAKVGFRSGGRRFFPDDIESITLRKHVGEPDE